MLRFIWTSDRRRHFNDLWSRGASSSKIAAELRTTEKSVRNYTARMKLHRFSVNAVSTGGNPGMTPEAIAFMEGKRMAFQETGQPEKAAEVESDMAESQRLALKFGVVLARQNPQ